MLFNGNDRMPDLSSGVLYASVQARALAARRGYETIYDTELGRWLHARQIEHGPTSGLTINEANQLWGRSSLHVCRCASGDVWLRIGETPKLDGIFFQQELVTLLKNPQVRRINGWTLKALQERPDLEHLPLETEHLGQIAAVLRAFSPRLDCSLDEWKERVRQEGIEKAALRRERVQEHQRARDLDRER